MTRLTDEKLRRLRRVADARRGEPDAGPHLFTLTVETLRALLDEVEAGRRLTAAAHQALEPFRVADQAGLTLVPEGRPDFPVTFGRATLGRAAEVYEAIGRALEWPADGGEAA